MEKAHQRHHSSWTSPPTPGPLRPPELVRENKPKTARPASKLCTPYITQDNTPPPGPIFTAQVLHSKKSASLGKGWRRKDLADIFPKNFVRLCNRIRCGFSRALKIGQRVCYISCVIVLKDFGLPLKIKQRSKMEPPHNRDGTPCGELTIPYIDLIWSCARRKTPKT